MVDKLKLSGLTQILGSETLALKVLEDAERKSREITDLGTAYKEKADSPEALLAELSNLIDKVPDGDLKAEFQGLLSKLEAAIGGGEYAYPPEQAEKSRAQLRADFWASLRPLRR